MTTKSEDQHEQSEELKELKESLKNWDFSGSPVTNYPSDTITLSSLDVYSYPNTVFGNNAVTGSISAATGPYTITGGTGITNPWATSTTANAGKLTLNGDNADIEINGVSLMSVLQERLNVLIPNPEIESEWEELKRIGDEYRAVEADIKEKMQMWNKLKSKS
jgi:hypothetical protein